MANEKSLAADGDKANLELAKSLYGEVQAMYGTNPSIPQVEVRQSVYSNIASVTVSARDIFIDFIEMPARPTAGRIVAPATRIYMTHHAARALAQVLANLIEDAGGKGRLETGRPPFEAPQPQKRDAKKQKRSKAR